MPFTQQFIQATTMIPVFAVHVLNHRRSVAQSCVGMIHSVFSFAMHMNTWWWQKEWPVWAVELYAADKCLILVVAWGFHYHVEPLSAMVAAVPVLVDAVHIALFQHRYVGNRFAYFDVFLLSYILYVNAVVLFIRLRRRELPTCVVLMAASIIGYGMDVHGLMHLCLVPGFWIWYEVLRAEEKRRKNIVNQEK